MKKTNIFTTLILGMFLVFMSCEVNAQTVPTCDGMGYTMTESTCNSKSKPFLRCPLDSTKVFCGLTACDLVTEKSCTGDYQCKTYHDTCPSKCKTCICTALPPSDWASYNLLIRPIGGECGTYGYKVKSWCDSKKYKCCDKNDPTNTCLVEMKEPDQDL